jgi:integrating conjugative element protein (TIGR03765 family)
VVIGDDEASRAWLQRRGAALRERGAVGLVVNVETVQGLARLRALAPGVPSRPWPATTWPIAWACGTTRR